MENLRVGIIGAGWIAEKAAITLKNLEGASCYAIASRSLEKAQAFAEKWQVSCAYGSYSELIADENVDLVYDQFQGHQNIQGSTTSHAKRPETDSTCATTA